MKTTLLLLCLLGVALSAGPKWYQLEGYTFQQFVEDFNKTYVSDEDYFDHQVAFENKLKEVIAFNNDSTQTYKKGINKSSDIIKPAPVNFGYNKALSKSAQLAFRNLKSKQQNEEINVEALPKEVDWRNKGVTSPVKDQGHCGSCWAFASTATIESHAAINSGQLKTLSTQQLVSCAPNTLSCGGTGGCEGSIAELAFNYVQLYGATSEYKYPYLSYFSGVTGDCIFNQNKQIPEVTVDGYVKLQTNSEEALLEAVANLGPVAVAVDASNWHDYETGIFNGCNFNANIDLNHVVVVEGYGPDYWLVRNSWGTAYGEKGYIRIAREKLVTCGIDQTPLDGQACSGQNQPTKVCGQCGILFDGSYPLNARVVD